jgi:hypothetical protein
MSNLKTKGHTNKKMNESVYAERRQVMDCIYKAKNLLRANGIQMPRIDVRITVADHDEESCGVARMGGRYIWIPETTLKQAYLYQVVLHELCHTIWGIGHDQKCKLMHTHVQELTDKDAEQIFLSYAKKYNLN